MAAADEPDFLIPSNKLVEELSCPICFGVLTDAYMLPCCSNSYCLPCIEEVLNRKKFCPCCNAPQDRAKLVKHHHIDRILQLVTDEKDKASKDYYEKLVAGLHRSPSQELAAVAAGGQASARSPLEEIFQRHIRNCLVGFEDSYNAMKKHGETEKATILQAYAARIALEPGNAGALHEECERQRNAITAQCEEALQAMLASYEQYLEKAVPPANLLSVRAFVRIVETGHRFNAVIKPSDCLQEVKALVEEHMKQQGDPLTHWNPACTFAIRNFAAAEGVDGAGKPAAEGGLGNGVSEVVIADEHRPLVLLGLYPGSEVLVYGPPDIKQTLPQLCFVKEYVKDSGQKVDYFHCQTCGQKWICKTCSKSCHESKGHIVVPFINQHKATYACCYCVKHKLCTL